MAHLPGGRLARGLTRASPLPWLHQLASRRQDAATCSGRPQDASAPLEGIHLRQSRGHHSTGVPRNSKKASCTPGKMSVVLESHSPAIGAPHGRQGAPPQPSPLSSAPCLAGPALQVTGGGCRRRYLEFPSLGRILSVLRGIPVPARIASGTCLEIRCAVLRAGACRIPVRVAKHHDPFEYTENHSASKSAPRRAKGDATGVQAPTGSTRCRHACRHRRVSAEVRGARAGRPSTETCRWLTERAFSRTRPRVDLLPRLPRHPHADLSVAGSPHAVRMAYSTRARHRPKTHTSASTAKHHATQHEG